MMSRVATVTCRHVAGLGHQPRQEGHELELLVVALIEIMLSREQGIPAVVAGVVDHGDLLIERLHHVRVEVLLIRDEQSDFHRAVTPYLMNAE
jgi:hypothetical protein